MGIDEFLKTLFAYGPQGVAFAIMSVVILYLYRALRDGDKETKDEIRKGAEALVESTVAIKESNESRLALARALDDFQRLLKEVVGRVDRANSLVDQIDRRMAIHDASRLGELTRKVGGEP